MTILDFEAAKLLSLRRRALNIRCKILVDQKPHARLGDAAGRKGSGSTAARRQFSERESFALGPWPRHRQGWRLRRCFRPHRAAAAR
jgi:hypothetical protein